MCTVPPNGIWDEFADALNISKIGMAVGDYNTAQIKNKTFYFFQSPLCVPRLILPYTHTPSSRSMSIAAQST